MRRISCLEYELPSDPNQTPEKPPLILQCPKASMNLIFEPEISHLWLPPEKAADHTTCKIPGQARAIYRVRGEATGLAELVATGECERIRDSKDKGDNCTMLALIPANPPFVTQAAIAHQVC